MHSAGVTAVDFRALVEQSADVIAVYDREHRTVYVNAAHDVRSADFVGSLREALDHVFATGESRTVEHTFDTPNGPRRFASLVVRAGDHACAVSRDVTDLHAARLFDVAVRTMMLGMCVIEAPSGRILFQNDRLVDVWGPASREIEGTQDYDAHVAFDRQGRRVQGTMWPAVRALGGETIVGERIELVRRDGVRKTISMNASPVRDVQGRITAAVISYQDVTVPTRAHDAAAYLAKAGALLEQFDPQTSLQAIIDLAVPVLADRAYIHLKTLGQPIVAALGHVDPAKLAAERARIGQPYAVPPGTAVSRVLAGGPAELVQIDDDVIAKAASDPGERERLRAQGYRSAVVAPLAGRDGVLGALTFSTAESGRRYEPADLEMLGELARRTGIALDNARLLAAEHEARQRAEHARDTTRRLQTLTARLSSALDDAVVAAVLVDAGRAALGATAGLAWLLRGDDSLHLIAAETGGAPGRLADFETFPLTTHAPICDAVKTARPLMFESLEAMLAVYPDVVSRQTTEYRAWAVMPFVVGGAGVGGVSFSFAQERRFSEEDRELLAAMIGQASLALERCKLLAADRQARAQAEAARVRERVLHVTAARLSSVQTVVQVGTVVSEEVIAALGAHSAAATIRTDDGMQIVATSGVRHPEMVGPFAKIPISTALPHCEAVLRSEIVWCASQAELALRYGRYQELWHTAGLRSWGAVPFTFEGRTIGALALSFTEDRELAGDDRELLRAMGQLVAQALERARLHEALQASEESLRAALVAAREREQDARLAERRKDEFLAMLGHELRNPLAPITTALDLMDLKTGSALNREREVIRRQVDHMTRLIDDLLDVSRITRGELDLVREVLEVSEVVARAIEMASPLLEKRLQQLSIDVPREGLLVDADPMRLSQVIQNLLTNAARYSDRHGEIAIAARSTADAILLEVRDSGVGIAPELMPRLFDLFVQGERTIDRAEGGLGLGLAIARSLCELHGGTITAASDGPGRGSTFTVRLPHATRPPVPRSERATERMPKLTRGMRVLVVDDNPDAAAMLHAYLEELGHEPAVAHDGVAALELAGTFKPEIAVLDIGLPVMDGYELARRLRDRLGRDKLRLIALTGYGQEADRTRAAEAGFDHHLVKPVAIEALTNLLTK